MAPTRTTHPARRADGPRKLAAALDAAPGGAPQLLEVVALRPSDELDTRWLLDGDTGVTRRLSASLREVAGAHGGSWYRLDRLMLAVLAPDSLVPGAAAMAARAAVSATSESLADCVFHGSVTLPEEEVGTQALALALARLQARARWSSRSTERQVRDVLLRLLATRRAGTSPRVAELALRVGRRVGLGMGELDVLVRAAELQDLGKALIPDAILSKSGALTPEEWAVVQRHPLMAEEILAAAPALAPVGRLVRCSQERYDGTGYPDALHGDAIPVGARIIAVCIAYDAMISDRPYRPALPTRAAIAEICRCAGRQFDPRVVDAFCAVVDEREDDHAPEPVRLAA
jgi:HD-GYP domain-containing protein (c-di-GMP phosphodiesterase class II)